MSERKKKKKRNLKTRNIFQEYKIWLFISFKWRKDFK